MKIAILSVLILILGGCTFSGEKPLESQDLTSEGQDLGVSIISVPQGGTGAQTFTSGECLVGADAGAITTQACGATGAYALGDLSDVATSSATLNDVLILQADGTFDLGAQTGSGGNAYAEFIQVGSNQQNVSTTPFLFVNGLLASTTVGFDSAIIYGNLDMEGGDITNYFSAACNAGEYVNDISDAGTFACTDATAEINSVVNALGGTNLTCATQSCNVDDAFVLLAGDTSSGIYTWSGVNTWSSDARVTGTLHATSTDFDALIVYGDSLLDGDATTTGDFVVGADGGSGTTTLSIEDDGTAGGCIEMKDTEGVLIHFYFSGTTQVIEAGACR